MVSRPALPVSPSVLLAEPVPSWGAKGLSCSMGVLPRASTDFFGFFGCFSPHYFQPSLPCAPSLCHHLAAGPREKASSI